MQLSWLIVSSDAPAVPAIDVTATATTKCVSNKVVVSALLKNDSSVPVKVTLKWGTTSKTFNSVAPGANAVHAFSTRQASVPAGVVTATVSATVGGQPVTKTVDAAYAAASCRS